MAKTTLYREIYDHIKTEIDAGHWKPGGRVPSEAELSTEFGVSRITSKKALELLADEKILYRVPGKGSFVGAAPESRSISARPSTPSIGILFPDFSETFGTDLLRGMILECERRGYAASVVLSLGNQEAEDLALDRFHRDGSVGVVVMPIHGEHYSRAMLKLVVEGFPLVSVDRFLHGMPAPFVGSDNEGAVRNAVGYLADQGHTRIGLVSPIAKKTSTIQDRNTGYEAGLNERHLPWDPGQVLVDLVSMLPGNFSEATQAADRAKILAFLKANPGMTALISVEYGIAETVCTLARSLGRSVPGDLSIFAFDGPEGMEKLTGIGQLKQREVEMGESAVALVDRLIRGEKTTEKIFLDVDLRAP